MKAAVLHAIDKPYILEEIPKPTIGPNEVLIETRTCGICRTDIHVQEGLAYVPDFPHVSGHEPAGVVVEVGDKVNDFGVGDRVTAHLFLCEGNELHDDIHNAPSATVQGIIGVTTHGGFAEYFKAPAKNLLKLPDNVSFADGGLVGCAVITAVHAFHRSHAVAGETAAIIGAGGIGALQAQILKAKGLTVISISRREESRSLALKHGSDFAYAPQDAKEQVAALTHGKGVAVAFDMVGTEQTMQTCCDILSIRGRLVMIGEEDECPPINTIQIAQRELEIIGSRNGGLQDARESLDMISRGEIKPMIDRIVDLDDINEAMDVVRNGKCIGRVIVRIKD